MLYPLRNEKGMTTLDNNSSSKDLLKAYNSSPYLSIKYDTYFTIYEELLGQYRGKEIVLVEVGVFNGGSLFMWREYLGPKARIIGIDLNPDAREWENHGFEIFIGDQSSDAFWINLFEKIGNIDVLVDDGGHTNRQQIVTTHHATQNINDGGILIVEDVHTNYFREFGNPSRYSFISYVHRIVDSVNSRAHSLRRTHTNYAARVYSVSFFESMVAIRIDSKLCTQSMPTSNNGASRNATDFRYQGRAASVLFTFKNKFTTSGSLGAKLVRRAADMALSLLSKAEIIRYRKYFKSRN